MRTYRRADLDAAEEAWSDYSSEWNVCRAEAAARGMLYPPSGSKFDSTEDPRPSQRAIVYRAMVDTPDTLLDAIRSSSSWSDVVRKVMWDLDTRREDADLRERELAWERRHYRGPMESIGALLTKFKDSMP